MPKTDCAACKILRLKMGAKDRYITSIRRADGSGGEFPEATRDAMEGGWPKLRATLAEIDKYAKAMGVDDAED